MNSLQKIGNWVGQGSLVALALSHIAKIGYIVGSYPMPAFFSVSIIAMPLVGAYVNIHSFILLFIIRFCMSFLLYKTTITALFATHYLAGFGSALSMRFNHWGIQVVVPALCMALFIAHPVAGQVWVYSLYWLIPMIIYGMRHSITGYFVTRIASAVRATFVAHALGSVAWAYYKPMTVTQWQLLLPIVAVERLLFAGAIVLCCLFIDWLRTLSVVPAHKQAVNPVVES